MKKVLIANRGEIACRIIRSCRALGLQTVAVFSEPDAMSLAVATADESFALNGSAALDSYLRPDRLLQAARATGADAVHPGYGFLAESEAFANAVEDAGLTWIGPTPQTIVDMGDKERARQLARAAGVPVLPGSNRFSQGVNGGVIEAGRQVGFPLLVKASAGGGGIGMRRVDREEDLLAAVEATQGMAQRAFGDGSIYLERYIAHARHVEVQVFGFGNGEAIHLHERDCSIQRRFQKIVEESPAPGLPSGMREAMFTAAVALCRQQRYRGAGTIEFVVDADSFDFYFLEMNTRIQVEHPVSEMNTGLDLIAMQLQLAAGLQTAVRVQGDVRPSGHAIEVRLYAERPAKGFLPSTGTLRRFRMPRTDESLRVDCGVREGDAITHFYDPMIAKLVGHGHDRNGSIERLLAAFEEVDVQGVETNLGFLKRTVGHPAFRAGQVETGFIERHNRALLPLDS